MIIWTNLKLKWDKLNRQPKTQKIRKNNFQCLTYLDIEKWGLLQLILELPSCFGFYNNFYFMIFKFKKKRVLKILKFSLKNFVLKNFDLFLNFGLCEFDLCEFDLCEFWISYWWRSTGRSAVGRIHKRSN